MKKRLFTFSFVWIILLIFFSILSASAADEEALGRQAEQAGNLRQALTHYVKALKADITNHQLREKIIKLARKIQPPPAIPEDVYKCMARGEAFVELAGDKEGYLRAAREFQKAADEAPWFADAYYNLGVVQDKAGLYGKAIKSLELYLLAALDAPDARKVRTLIYKTEVRQEEAERIEREPEKAVVNKKESQPPTIYDLTGYWNMKGSSSSATATTQDGMLAFDCFENKCSGGSSPLIKFSINGYTLSGQLWKLGLRQTGTPSMPSYACLEKLRKQGGFEGRYVQITGTISKDLKTIKFRYRDRAHLPGCRLGYADFNVEYYR